MSKRVIDIFVENCMLTVKYSDCTEIVWPISNCGDKTPEPEKPGDPPDPHQQPDTVCRIALKVPVGIVTDRYIDFLNAATPASVASFGVGLAAVVSAKLAAYAWSAALYPSLYAFGFNMVTSGDRDTALATYNADPTGTIAIVQEILYCLLPANGAISDQTRQIFRAALVAQGGVFFVRLAEFLGIYPLERLRDEAFEASITTDTVSCTFDCGEAEVPAGCGSQFFDWDGIGATPSTWVSDQGAIDTSSWSGDPMTIFPTSSTYTAELATRGVNQEWNAIGAVSPGGNALRYLSLVWTPETPCTITHLGMSTISNSGGGTKTAHIAVQLLDNSWHLLTQVVSTPAPVPDNLGLPWSGDPITVKAVRFITGHYKGTGSVSIYMRTNSINVT